MSCVACITALERKVQSEWLRCSYYAGMVAITIRNVPTKVRDELAARAARSGRSLQEYLAAELTELASRRTAADVLSAARARAREVRRTVEPEDLVSAREDDRR